MTEYRTDLGEFKPSIPLAEIRKQREAEEQARQTNCNSSATHEAKAAKDQASVEISINERKMLGDLISRPTVILSKRYADLGMAASTGNRCQNKLIEKKLCTEFRLDPVGKGASIKLLQPTEQGLKMLGFSLADMDGDGRFFHRHFQGQVRRKIRRTGARGVIEYCLHGKRADIGAITAEAAIAHEVECSSQHAAAGNIRKDFNAGFAAVHVWVPSYKLMETIGKDWQQTGISCGEVVFHLLAELL